MSAIEEMLAVIKYHEAGAWHTYIDMNADSGSFTYLPWFVSGSLNDWLAFERRCHVCDDDLHNGFGLCANVAPQALRSYERFRAETRGTDRQRQEAARERASVGN